MITRREVLGVGLALTSISCAIGLNLACGVTAVKDHTGLPKLGAMVLDESLSVSPTLIDVLHHRKHDLSLLTIGLDAFRSIELKHLFNSGQMIAGLSSGATLFCLERIAWDHGYRMTRRSEHEFVATAASSPDSDATVSVLAEAIIRDRPESFAAAIATGGHAYRPSMTDDTLHAWIMQTAVTSKQRTV